MPALWALFLGDKTFPVPDSVVRIAPKIDALVNDALTARAEAARLLEAANAEVERLVSKTSSD